MAGREPFDFNTLSSGYAALDIVVDLIIRMEKQLNRSFDFSISGIVLIDEIETHLHLELQKNVMKLLTTVFPNIQFIVSSHSPFILNSLDNVVIYDLEKKVFVEHGLADVPYSGIVKENRRNPPIPLIATILPSRISRRVYVIAARPRLRNRWYKFQFP